MSSSIAETAVVYPGVELGEDVVIGDCAGEDRASVTDHEGRELAAGDHEVGVVVEDAAVADHHVVA